MSALPILRETADTVRLFDPADGSELILADTDTATLAELRDLIRETEEDQRLAKQALDAELISRMDRAATWTLNEGGFKITAPSPAPQDDYDAQALRVDLEDARDRGLITDEAVDNAVQLIIDYKARAGGIKALLKLGGEVAEIVERHHTLVERTRRVSVKRP